MSAEPHHDNPFKPTEPPAATARPKPCDECRHKARCASESLGCHALILYMRHASPARSACAPRQPNHDLYVIAMTRAPKVAALQVYKRDEDGEDE
jgi:hypothetical protein